MNCRSTHSNELPLDTTPACRSKQAKINKAQHGRTCWRQHHSAAYSSSAQCNELALDTTPACRLKQAKMNKAQLAKDVGGSTILLHTPPLPSPMNWHSTPRLPADLNKPKSTKAQHGRTFWRQPHFAACSSFAQSNELPLHTTPACRLKLAKMNKAQHGRTFWRQPYSAACSSFAQSNELPLDTMLACRLKPAKINKAQHGQTCWRQHHSAAYSSSAQSNELPLNTTPACRLKPAKTNKAQLAKDVGGSTILLHTPPPPSPMDCHSTTRLPMKT